MTIPLYHERYGSFEGAFEGRPHDSAPLVLVHGGAGSISTDWSYAIPRLSRNRPVVAVELQGHGHTPHTDRAYTFENPPTTSPRWFFSSVSSASTSWASATAAPPRCASHSAIPR